MKTVTDKMADLANIHLHLKTMNLSSATNMNNNTQEDQTILHPKPLMFKLIEIKSINNDKILLAVKPENMPTAIWGDGCTTNMKASRLIKTGYSLKSLFSRCASHTSAGTIRQLCTSVNSFQIDVKAIYEKLCSILKHLTNSPRSSKLLNNALKILDMNNIHLFNWGSTKKAGFLDACMCSGFKNHFSLSWYHCYMLNKTRRDKHSCQS